jgi:hypothetical protein
MNTLGHAVAGAAPPVGARGSWSWRWRRREVCSTTCTLIQVYALTSGTLVAAVMVGATMRSSFAAQFQALLWLRSQWVPQCAAALPHSLYHTHKDKYTFQSCTV